MFRKLLRILSYLLQREKIGSYLPSFFFHCMHILFSELLWAIRHYFWAAILKANKSSFLNPYVSHILNHYVCICQKQEILLRIPAAPMCIHVWGWSSENPLVKPESHFVCVCGSENPLNSIWCKSLFFKTRGSGSNFPSSYQVLLHAVLHSLWNVAIRYA